MLGPTRAERFDIADIVRAHRASLESVCTLRPEQKRALTDIAQCRTAILGGHLDACVNCGYEHPAYNSCRNRHCPKCQALAQEKWIAEQRTRMLDTRHFHVVFTLPTELRQLAAFAPHAVYGALFRAAALTLIAFGESRLKATIGATLVLHTWTRELAFHPHVHAIVTGGGLTLDDARWQQANRRFLFPVKAMSRVFRGKMKQELKTAYRKGAFARFDEFRDPEGFGRLLRAIAKKNWYVYAKPSFANGEYVLQYLGRYTHRVGIANSRILATGEHIAFRTKGNRVATLTPIEFLRRLVRHVLPNGFQIRHFGLNASTSRRAAARLALGCTLLIATAIGWHERLLQLTGRDITLCPQCAEPLVAMALPNARAPPEVVVA